MKLKLNCRTIDNPQYSSNRSFFDFMFILLCCLMTILMLIEIKKKSDGIRHKAEFVITMEWDKDDQNDMDLWLKDPLGNIIYYKDKESFAMFLDRDDLGHSNDKIVINGQERIIKINQEIISIRTYIPGRWIVAVHFYKRHDKKKPGTEIPVSIQMNKMNPKVKIIFKETKTMTHTWQEETVAIFEMLPDGTIANLELHGEMPMVHERIPVQAWGPDADGDGDPEDTDNGLTMGDPVSEQEMRQRRQQRQQQSMANENIAEPDYTPQHGGL